MLEGPPEVLVREYRGYRYVAEDLFEVDAAVLDEEGWDVHSTEWDEDPWQGLAWALYGLHLLTGTAALGPTYQRSEYVLTVTYHRQPGADG